ncbi:hypothetical protein GCM10011328_40600 [Hafnia psychrotolerans]|uniref:Uncharacterized protein n=1 Tax=Hafnia psychrotolerans TaxID=1477018 RepID=A0ABQ1H6M8_9GAMM|nr:hypothetical protein GCM10011328_40600 [Hafnia psychrotolerans]
MVKEPARFANSIYAIYGMPRCESLCDMKMSWIFEMRDGEVNIGACKGYAQGAWAVRILSDR